MVSDLLKKTNSFLHFFKFATKTLINLGERFDAYLFQAEYFKGLSCESKVLYGLMLDRMDLSIKNRWFDEENRVYIVFSISDVMEKLSCGKQKAVKLVAELAEIGLIEKKRIGLGRANVIYVKNFTSGIAQNLENLGIKQSRTSTSMKIKPQEVPESEIQTYENQTVRSTVFAPQEVSETNIQKFDNQTFPGMKNELPKVCLSGTNHTECIQTDDNTNQSNQSDRSKLEAIKAYREIICDNIEYEVLCCQYPQKRVNEIVELMLEVITSNKRSFRIAGEEIEANLVKTRFMQIGMTHIQYVFTCLDSTTTKATNIKQYLLTVLYNSTITIAHYYQNRVQHDMYGQA